MTMTATAASAQRLPYQGRLSSIRRRTPAAMSGVGGHCSPRSRLLRRASSSVGSGMGTALLDPLPQACQRAREARLDSPLRDPERCRRLLAAQVEEVPAGDHQAVVVVELVDETDQPPPLVRLHGRRLGGWGRIPLAEAFGQPKLQMVPATGRANAVARLVGDDPEQPRPRLCPGPEAVQGSVGLDEGVLGGILRLRGGAGDEVGRPEGELLVALHDLLIGVDAAALRAHEQLSVLWPALHRIGSITTAGESGFRPDATDAVAPVLRESEWRESSACSRGWSTSTRTGCSRWASL